MNIQKFVVLVLLVAGSFSGRAAESPSWLQSLQSPVSAPVRFYGRFVANDRVAVSLGGVTAADTNNVSGWICGDNVSGTIYTPLKEVDLEIYKTYTLNISGPTVYDAKAYLQEPHLTDLLAGKGKNAQQYNRYRLYVLKPGEAEWKLLCNDTPPGWNNDDSLSYCTNLSISYQIQLRPDVGARPMVQPGLAATYGSADVDIWERDEDPAAQSSAPGDEDPLTISADKTGYTADRMSIMWGVNLGHLRDGQPAGKVRIIEAFLSPNILTPAALVYSARSDDTNDIDVVTVGTPAAIRQIKSAETFVDVITLSGSYELRFYPTNAFGAKTGGLYPMVGTPTNFVAWRIDNAGASSNTFRIQEIRNGTTKTSLLTFTGTNLWTLTRGVENEARIVTRHVTMQAQGTNHWDRIDVEEVKDGLGRTSSKTGEFWTDYGARHELTRVTNGVGGPALITAFTYASISGESSQLSSTTYPDGYWERRTYSSDTNDIYHPYGSLVRIIQPWKDSPIGSADNNCLVSSYYYQAGGDGSFQLQRWHDASFFGDNPSSDNIDKQLSATYEEMTAFDEDACSSATEIAEIRKIGGSYGEGLRTKTKSAYAGRLAGQLYSKWDSSGKQDSYDYVFGQWDKVNRTFAGTGSTNDLAQVIYHGADWSTDPVLDTGESGDLIEPIYFFRNKSTMEVRVVSGGHLVAKELYVYVDPVTEFSLVERTLYDRDALGHLTNVVKYPNVGSGPQVLYQADWTGGNAFPGDLKLSQTDQSGVKTFFTYDSLKRVKTLTKEGASIAGYPSQANIVQTLDYDASANVLTNTTSAGTLVQRMIAAFDLSGRLTNALSTDGLTTSYSYPNGGLQTNITYSSGATQLVQNYLDRRLASVTGTAVLNQFFDYSLLGNSNTNMLLPQNVATVRTGAVTSARWKKSITDHRNKVAEETQPGFRSGFEKYKIYDQRLPGGLLDHISEMGLHEDGSYEFLTKYDRDEFGAVIASSINANGDFEADTTPAGPDRVTQSNEYFEQNAQTNWFKVSEQLAFPTDGNATAVLVSRTKERLSGFGANQVSQTYTYDADTNQTVTTVTVNLTNKTVTTTITQPQSSLTATEVSVNGLPQTESTLTVAAPMWHYYDALGREIGMLDPLGFASGTRYDPATSQVMATTNKSGKITSYQYYPAGVPNAGLLYCETGPTGKKKYQNYNGRGQVTQVWGDVPYPEQMSYNNFGDLVTLTTYRTNNVAWTGTNWPNPAGGDVTTWLYDEPTGLLTNKTDATGLGVQYDYYANYLPKATILARGVGTFTTYADNGDLTQVDITNKWTGSTVISSVISSNYNRMGTPRSVFDDAGEHKMVYDYANRVLSEAYTNGLLSGTVLTYHYDPVKGKDRLVVRTPSGTWLTNQYGFDGYGRIASVTNGGSYSSLYTYLPNSDLLQITTSQNGATPVLTSTRTWENGYRLKSISNAAAGRTASGHTYDYDNLDRRYRATLEDGSAWNYGYNDRDELTSGKRSWSDASAVAGQQFEYLYDLIGNRTNELAGGDTNGANLRQTSYTVNNLNEYSRIITPGYKDVLGLATVGDAVTVNNATGGGLADRKNDYFHREITITNGPAAICQSVATVSGANNATGNLIVAKNDQTLTNDVDGNLIFDGIWSYQWTAENRLASVNMTNVANVTNALRKKLDFAYDSEGRRIAKTVSTWNGSTFVSPVTNRFISDGWRIIAEIDSSGNPTRSYMWGLDLSGSLENAGGIGGVLMVRDHAGNTYHFAGSDGNGNATVLVNAATQNISARYDYSPYNELLRATGPMVGLNNICAASKYWDRETKLSYFGQRYYSPSLGRWTSKDLAGENGGINLYGFVKNQPIIKIDPTGLATLGEQAAAAGIAAGLGEGIEIGVTLVGRVRETVEAINAVQEVGSVIIEFEVEAGEGIEAFETVMEATSRAAQGFRNGSTSLNRMGQAVHKAYSGVKDMALELSNGKRVDFIDFAKGIVRELKPNNLRAIRLGGKQLEGYLKVLRSEFPNIEWKGLIDTYSF